MSSEDFLYFVEMPSRPVGVMEFAGLVADALHGNGDADADLVRRGLVIMDLEEKIRAGVLPVRNQLSLSIETFLQGEALWRTVVLPVDARPFLASRQIGLRLVDGEASQSKRKGTEVVWTPDFVQEVADYRLKHTEEQTAEHFGKSGPLIRRKLAEHKKAVEAKKLPAASGIFAQLGKR